MPLRTAEPSREPESGPAYGYEPQSDCNADCNYWLPSFTGAAGRHGWEPQTAVTFQVFCICAVTIESRLGG